MFRGQKRIIEYPKTFTNADFLKADVQCLKSKQGEGVGMADYEGFTNIGEVTAKPQTMVCIGKRYDLLDKDVGGLCHVELHDSSNNDIEGEIKIVLANANRLKKAVILKRRTNIMYKTAPTDRSKQPLVKVGMNSPPIFAREDSVVQLLFKPDTDGVTVDFDNSLNVILIDYIERQEGR